MADTLSVLNLAQVQFLTYPPVFFGYQNAAQSLSNTTWTALSIDNEVDDTYNGHSNVTNPSRYTCQVAGWYAVGGCYAPVGAAGGFRAVRIQKNGSPVLGSGCYILPASPTSNPEIGVVTPTVSVQLAVNDYVEVAGWQSSGGALNTVLDVDLRCSLTVRFLHF